MKRSARTLGTLAASTVAVIGLAGCGGGNSTPAAALDSFYSAVVGSDWEQACSYLDPTWESLINHDRLQSCEAWLADHMQEKLPELDDFEIVEAEIDVEGRSAGLGSGVVATPGDDDYSDTFTDHELVQTSNGWVLSRGFSEDDDSDDGMCC